ncbi:hypothetical protein AVEN_64419-1 [Araneus ventricosus]|uniref:Uncharacterized protein n=1 Tax=Araneus ventricosus TaxID=182803 RepID=A0A4Y2SLV0_ARAVE|nr:hypothetical protein AVEN_64419-1 [Araneus ventricosus]
MIVLSVSNDMFDLLVAILLKLLFSEPVDETNRTKRETCAVSFISQDSSTAIDKAETNLRSSLCRLFLFEDILTLPSWIVLADSGNFARTRNRPRFVDYWAFFIAGHSQEG